MTSNKPAKIETFRDPVCGMDAPIHASAGNVTYRGARYDFCSHECQMKFQADPAPFVDAPEVA